MPYMAVIKGEATINWSEYIKSLSRGAKEALAAAATLAHPSSSVELSLVVNASSLYVVLPFNNAAIKELPGAPGIFLQETEP
jgi:hypothetical protein